MGQSSGWSRTSGGILLTPGAGKHADEAMAEAESSASIPITGIKIFADNRMDIDPY